MKNIRVLTGIFTICIAALVSCKSSKTTNTDTDTATAAAAVTPEHSSQNSLDWDGIYRGVLPCADCEGIETIISLNSNLTFTIKTRYLGKPAAQQIDSGNFVWNSAGNTITLQGLSGRPSSFFVGENTLTQLDMQGNRVTGANAASYILSKQQFAILNRYWKLVELNGKPVVVDTTMQREPHIIFRADTNRVAGNGGCNNFFGSFALKGLSTISITRIGSTMMACPDLQTESEFFKALQSADNFFVNADELTLNNAQMKPLAKFKSVYMH